MDIETVASRRPAEDPGDVFPPHIVPDVPAWVAESTTARLRHVVTGFDDARGTDAAVFQRRVMDAYNTIFKAIESTACSHPVRFWTFAPGINDNLGAGLDRYMAFNIGRHEAFAGYFGGTTSFGRSAPTATVLGVAGDRFLLHCLAADEPGVPVENPRQIAPYHYSRRFGPVPPCFARATLLIGHADRPTLLVGGTASITGEESRHIGSLEAQAVEVVHNLASVVASAAGRTLPEDADPIDIRSLLCAFREVRVCYTDPAHRARLAEFVRARFSVQCRVEWTHASLCRPELLLEIEGVADLPVSDEVLS